MVTKHKGRDFGAGVIHINSNGTPLSDNTTYNFIVLI
jgi:hypothetical protein